jgi:adenosylcobinamide-GDP ribazoletransferase
VPLVGFRDLLAFLTTLPVGGGSIEGAAEAFHLAPLAGLAVGLIAGAAGAAAGILWGACMAGAVYLAAYILATGGLHLDGFTDVEDVLGSGLRGGEALRVLKDPRRGSHAVAMLAADALLASAAAAALYSGGGPLVLAAAAAATHAAAGASMVLTARNAPPPPYQGLSTLFHEAARRPGALRGLAASLTLALAPTAALAALPASPAGLLVLAASLAPLAAFPAGVWWALRVPVGVLGFANGDVLGYTYELVRAWGLLASLAVLAGARLH